VVDRLVYRIARHRQSDAGATMVEYAFLVMLIALVAAAGAYALGGALDDFFLRARDCLANGVPTC
jgi:Flp pilus assembly pilin Flp